MMHYQNCHLNWLAPHDSGEYSVLVGVSCGRVSYLPVRPWLYSLRLFFGVVKIEILWTTGRAES